MSLLIPYIVFHLFCALVSHIYLLPAFIDEVCLRCEMESADLDSTALNIARWYSLIISLIGGPVSLFTTVLNIMGAESPRRIQLW